MAHVGSEVQSLVQSTTGKPETFRIGKIKLTYKHKGTDFPN